MNEPELPEPDERRESACPNAGAGEETDEAESLFEHLPANKRGFLSAFCELGSVRRAAEAAKVGQRSHYRWRTEDPAYAEAFALAQDVAADTLETEAIRRARDGWDEPQFRNSGLVGTIKKYSDQLLILLLKGNRPEKYGDRLQHAGRIDGEPGRVVLFLPDNGRDPDPDPESDHT